MTRFEELPPDQRAVLSLLLRQRKRYDEVASVLGIEPGAVHDRAHAALAVLAPRQARLVDPADRERIGEYLLGQQTAAQAAATKAYLASSTPAREWARALAVELVKLATEALPEIPSGAPPAQPAPPPAPPAKAAAVDHDGAAADPSAALPISRRGGAILLAAIVVIAAVVIAILVSSGGGNNNGAGNQTASHSSTQSASQTKESGSSKAKLEWEAALKPPQAGGTGEGAALIASEGSKRALYLAAKGLPATDGFAYVVWLIPRHGQPFPFGRTPSVGAKGTLQAAEVLTSSPSSLAGIEITRETAAHPKVPGTVVLKGDFRSAPG